MGMKRVANDRSKYTSRSKIGLQTERKGKDTKVVARQKFEAGPDGYFVWCRAQKNET